VGGELRLPRLPPKESGPKRQHSHYHGSKIEILLEPEERDMLPHLTRTQTTELLKQWRKKRVRETEKDNDTGTGSEAAASEVARKKASRKDKEDDGQRSMFRTTTNSRLIDPVANASCKKSTSVVWEYQGSGPARVQCSTFGL
jgi:hypothetical protein